MLELLAVSVSVSPVSVPVVVSPVELVPVEVSPVVVVISVVVISVVVISVVVGLSVVGLSVVGVTPVEVSVVGGAVVGGFWVVASALSSVPLSLLSLPAEVPSAVRPQAASRLVARMRERGRIWVIRGVDVIINLAGGSDAAGTNGSCRGRDRRRSTRGFAC